MGESLNTGLSLMGIGMSTVFLVLALVVLVGKGLIQFVNRFVPEEIKPVINDSEVKDNRKIAAISAAVEAATGGKGYITRIEKLN